ncbi:uncharacterized protein LOC111692176 [Anoplophora glabripennis]|uniref:uncharacterized protein LOC111692176 n=1 Tax=Anoplophora glabripennis TaxID=217634 RepID=UPI000C791A1C|nr:uncharacterized protein LOC111692176 [Anoplophora glabripennis]
MSFENNLLRKTKHLKIKDDQIINILLLGETGVGKSTFINSIANYLTYSDFKKAEKEELITLIPLKCKMKDKYGEYHIIQIGSEDDQNECLEVGMSATQHVKSYVFPIWNGTAKVRLIDTPGIGDVRGVLQDYTNCENILSYIGQLHELHAICCLFKPTNSRITNFFNYCLTQILSRLDKSASKNLIFIFTNTRGSDYGPGDTFASLQKIIDDIKATPPHVDIPLDTRNNVFCFDNEAYRFLAAVKKKVEFGTSIKQRNYESWKRSVDQCFNLIKYITGDSQQPPLKPHFIKSTSAINEARRLIVQLSQPLAEISQLISDNLYALKKHKENLDLNSDTLDELRQKLYMPVIGLDVITLTQPVTVCASRKCAEIYKVNDINKWHYKQRCHDPCFLKNVPKEVVGSPELVKCAAIDSSTSACMKCHCDFSTHMHVYYMTKTVENKTVDKNVKQTIDSKEVLLQNARKLITDISRRKDELENEHNIIVRTCAKFAHFLQNNAIIPFSDSYKDYIEYLIMREKSLGPLSQMSVIHHLQKLLQEYEEAKQSFSEALLLQKKIGESDVLITPQKIQESIQELYRLKYNGKKIKELYECQKKSRTIEYKHSEYVHEIPYQPEEDSSKNQKKNTTKKTYHQSRESNKATYGYQTKNNEKGVRDYSQSRYRDHSLPPSYPNSSNHPPDPRYQYNSRPYHPPYNHPRTHCHSRIDPWINHPSNYPGNQRPHSSLGDYPYRYTPVPGPDMHYYPPNAYNPGYCRTDMGVPNRNNDVRNSYELKVVLNGSKTEPLPNNPPSHLPPSGQQFQPDFYPPGTSYSPNYEDFLHYNCGRYDNYHFRGTGRPQQSQRAPQNRPNERGNYSRGRGGYRGRRGGQQWFPKNNNLKADSDTDTD